MASKEFIYVQLLGERTIVFRPTWGEKVSDMVYRLLPTENYDSEDEQWEFQPGSVVLCMPEELEGEKVLIARRKIT